jgi:ATP-dependent helicase/nuclease subunit A
MASSILKYEASAGSGKTYRLALEYLGRLLQAFAGLERGRASHKDRQKLLGSILAITFTVKAAQEMKKRILEKLKAFALNTGKIPLKKEDEEFLGLLANETHLSKNKIVELSGDLIELVLASYDDFNVKTIDSLMSAMVKAISPDLELPADYEIAIDAGGELEARARSLLAGMADSQWERLEKTLEEFKNYDPYSGWKIDEALTEKLIQFFYLDLREGIAEVNASRQDQESRFRSHRDGFRQCLEDLLDILHQGSAHANGRVVNRSLQESVAAFAWNDNNLFKLEEFLKKAFFKKAAPRDLIKNSAPGPFAARVSDAHARMRSSLQKLALDIGTLKTLPYREFFPDFLASWKQDKDTLFVDEFSRTLAGRFAEWGISGFPYLYMKMSDRFRHFLFDEFQDTSTLQFKALAPLIDEVLSQEKKASLFIVGDRKQAIYRWRGGNSGLMEESLLREEIPAINNLVKEGFSHTLNKNWRSLREIVDFNNEFWDPGVISQIAVEPVLQEAIQANFTGSRQELPADKETAGGYVELSLQVETERAGEEDAGAMAGEEEDGGAISGRQLGEVRKIIERLRGHGYEYSDIAVLVRKNIQVRDIVRYLGREGIPTISDQSLMLDSNSRVNEIIAFFKFLDYPPDDLNFHAFVSGRIFQEEAGNMYPQEKAAFSEDVFIGRRGPIYKLFQDKFPGCWAGLIEPFFQSVGFLPPYDLFSDMCQVFHFYENFSADTPFFLALGDTLHGAELQEGNSIAGFLQRWDKMVENRETPTVAIPENSPGVWVLTMHQSKGLEFPAVIVPINESKEKNPGSLYWNAGRPYHITNDIAMIQDELKEILCQENTKSDIDLLNLLYVAFTRAREALFVPVAAKKIPKAQETDRNGLAKRIAKASDVICCHPLPAWTDHPRERLFRRGELGQKKGRPTAAVAPVAIPSKKVLTRSWQVEYLVFKKARIEENRDRSGSERGQRVHDLLSRLGDIADPEKLAARVRELAAQACWPESETDAVSSFLCRNEVFSVLCRGREFHNEKEIVDHTGTLPELRRLDRLQAGPGEVLVIDFKTGKEKSDEYVSQMREYLRAASPLYPDRKCTGFLLYIDRGEVEEVQCSN